MHCFFLHLSPKTLKKYLAFQSFDFERHLVKVILSITLVKVILSVTW
jgi:hypothetical protein